MVSMGIRFDFRNPAFAGTTMSERYGAALEMCEWAEGQGFDSITLSEHHGCDDGYLPVDLRVRGGGGGAHDDRPHPPGGRHRTTARPDPRRRRCCGRRSPEQRATRHRVGQRLRAERVRGVRQVDGRPRQAHHRSRCHIAPGVDGRTVPVSRAAPYGSPRNRFSNRARRSGSAVPATARHGAPRESPTRSCRRCRSIGTPTATRCACSASLTRVR